MWLTGMPALVNASVHVSSKGCWRVCPGVSWTWYYCRCKKHVPSGPPCSSDVGLGKRLKSSPLHWNRYEHPPPPESVVLTRDRSQQLTHRVIFFDLGQVQSKEVEGM